MTANPKLRAFFAVVRTRFWVWFVPTALGLAGAAVQVATQRPMWSATQSLLVRDEVGGQRGLGRFDSVEAMKTAQETIQEMVRNPQTVRTVLEQIGPHTESRTIWPSPTDVAGAQKRFVVRAPNGAEFGRTEVLHLSATAESRERAARMVTLLYGELERRLRELHERRTRSIMDENFQRIRIAESDLASATQRLQQMEAAVGSDLGELRVLNETSAGDGNLRSQQVAIKLELRQMTAQRDSFRQLRELLAKANNDPDLLVATPNTLLETQPSIRRLKDGLIDAQLKVAELAGKISTGHPQYKSAIAAEREIRDNLHDELRTALRGVEFDVQVRERQAQSLETQLLEVNRRLDRLAELRAPYNNLIAEVRRCSEVLEKTNKEQADARGSHANQSSLITRLDGPTVSDRPVGPGRSTVLAAGLFGGLLSGVGLVFLIAPPRSQGRRWSDYLPWGRRATDLQAPPVANRPAAKPASVPGGRRAEDQTETGERRTSSGRRAADQMSSQA